MVRSQMDMLLAMHHSLVGTAPPLPLKGVPKNRCNLGGRLPQGAPSLVAPLLVTQHDGDLLAAVRPPTPVGQYIGRILEDPECSTLLAKKGGRVSDVVHHFAGSASQLAMLVRHGGNLAYTQVGPPSPIAALTVPPYGYIGLLPHVMRVLFVLVPVMRMSPWDLAWYHTTMLPFLILVVGCRRC